MLLCQVSEYRLKHTSTAMTEFLIQDRERFEATRRVQRDEATQNSGMFESVP